MSGPGSRSVLRHLPAALAVTGLSAGAGVVVTLAFPPVAQWWTAPLGLAVLEAVTRTAAGSRLGRAAWRGLCFGLGLFVPLLYFTAVSMGSPLGWAALSVVEALYLAAFALVWAAVSRLPRWQRDGLGACLGRVVAFALLFAAVEELRSSWPWGGFPFGRLAFTVADAPLLPAAAYGGSVGVTFLLALAGALVGEALTALRRLRVLEVLAAVVAAAGVLLAPMFLPLSSLAQDGTVRVGAVQGSLPPGPRTGAGAEASFHRALEVTGRHAEESKDLAAQTGRGSLDVVVWPENSADRDPRSDPQARALVEEAAQALGAPVVVGAVPYEERDGRRVRYNDMVVWEPGLPAGEDATRPFYRKHKPVPFGEWVPWREQVRRVTDQVDRISVDLLPGSGPTTLTVRGAASGRQVTFAMGICFEVAYDSVLREGVRGGGQVIVVPTNNASFGTSSEAAQQLEQGRVQAVIHGRSVVQVSTVGVTAVISPKGVVEQRLEPYAQGALVADVPVRSALTVADRLGAWPARLVVAGAGVLGVVGLVSLAGRRTALARARRRARRR